MYHVRQRCNASLEWRWRTHNMMHPQRPLNHSHAFAVWKHPFCILYQNSKHRCYLCALYTQTDCALNGLATTPSNFLFHPLWITIIQKSTTSLWCMNALRTHQLSVCMQLWCRIWCMYLIKTRCFGNCLWHSKNVPTVTAAVPNAMLSCQICHVTCNSNIQG